jgi:aminotransferase in exopolysaccharide biosynthesis
LHEPRFAGNEKKYINECIDSTFVSSVGTFVTRFEKMVAEFTGAKYAVATVNGTSALHISLLLSDVRHGDEVITQALTFVATANAIAYTGANPVFVDVDLDTMGLSPQSLEAFLFENAVVADGFCFNKISGKRIKACVPMHTFGHPCRIDEIVSICSKYNIDVIEDAAESLGSFFKNQHTGTFGKFGIVSFNGNKTITTGGGGMILTNDEELGRLAKHLTTTAKIPHQWEFVHDMIAYNYRLTNLSAALGCAQMEQLSQFLLKKRSLAESYASFFETLEMKFVTEPRHCQSNYWLNTLILDDVEARKNFITFANQEGIMVRPVWQLMNRLSMFRDCQSSSLENSEWLADRVVNIPSSAV